MTIFVSQSHISSAGISQGSFHGIHCSQLDATNCPTTILRNSLFCFSNLENKGALQAALTGKSYIFNTKQKGKVKKETSFSYSSSFFAKCPVSMATLMPLFNTSKKRMKSLLSLSLILWNFLPVKRGLQATRRDHSFSSETMKLM